MTRRPERDKHRHRLAEPGRVNVSPGSADDQPFWIDSAVMARRLRDAQADPALRDDLHRLFPDTLADL